MAGQQAADELAALVVEQVVQRAGRGGVQQPGEEQAEDGAEQRQEHDEADQRGGREAQQT